MHSSSATLRAKDRMSSLRWSAKTIAIILIVGGLFCAANYAINLYGVFGDVKGRTFLPYGDERTAKYLFARNYIPSNFEAVLVGSSVSLNWNTSHFHRWRTYNLSVDGGNSTEEHLILSQVLSQKRLQGVIFVVHPYLTQTYGVKSAEMNQQAYWGAWGSIQLMRAYVQWAKLKVRHQSIEHDAFGTWDFPPPKGAAGNEEITGRKPFEVNEDALQEYSAMVAAAQRNGATVIAVIPPVPPQDMSRYETYWRRVRTVFGANVTVINCNEGAFQKLRSDPTTFVDGVHLSHDGAEALMQLVDKIAG